MGQCESLARREVLRWGVISCTGAALAALLLLSSHSPCFILYTLYTLYSYTLLFKENPIKTMLVSQTDNINSFLSRQMSRVSAVVTSELGQFEKTECSLSSLHWEQVSCHSPSSPEDVRLCKIHLHPLLGQEPLSVVKLSTVRSGTKIMGDTIAAWKPHIP